MSLLPKDTELKFPHLITIPASAGSGKTYTLAYRYVQFLLSDKIAANGLRNILAVTFTKLAAKEMKERILNVLKSAALGNRTTIDELSGLVTLTEEEIIERAARLVEKILAEYSDFNIRTIDSFLTTVFKASAIELGVQPNIGIEFDHDALFDLAFRQYSMNLREGSEDARFIDDVIAVIEANEYSTSGYTWNPFSKISKEVRQLQKQFGRYAKEPLIIEGEKDLAVLSRAIIEKAEKLKQLLSSTTLPVNHYFAKDVDRLCNGDVFAVATKGKGKYFNKFSDDAGAQKEIKRLFAVITPMERDLERFMLMYSQMYYQPFVRAVAMLERTMHEVKLLEGKVVIDDVNRSLARYIVQDIVPEVYLKLGERIAHFMIDEFQDTSPIQWKNLHPLIEEALSKGGSLFAVGDTKQSIYSFRGGDWKIFRDLSAEKYFRSVPVTNLPLERNYRSEQILVDVVKDVFSTHVAAAQLDALASQSGLFRFAQNVPEKQRNKGYVEVKRIDKNDEASAGQRQKEYIVSAVQDCVSRGYTLGDIAILTSTNAEVVEISAWLNSASIEFLSMSTLDIRKRKKIVEIIALLRFLDSPIDNLSFYTFLSGELFANVLARDEHTSSSSRRKKPAESSELFRGHIRKMFVGGGTQYFYRMFRDEFPELWDRYFERLFTHVGYMPLYDIVSETLKTFSVFDTSPLEESAFIKLLECVKQFENSGNNSLNDFLSFSSEEGSDGWNVNIPGTVNAVRIMTVHKAKGLGFPVVIVSLQEKRTKSNSLVTMESDEGLSVLRVGKQFGERNETLKNIYAERENEQIIDELNKIYVALTRAEQEMYVAVMYKKVENLPASILPEGVYGGKHTNTGRIKHEKTLPVIASLHHHHPTVITPARYQKIGMQETRRGDAIHDVLARIEFFDGTGEQEIASAFLRSPLAADIDAGKEQERLLECLNRPEIRPYFERIPDRSVLREQDISAPDGRLYRVDRIILDKDSAAVIDYKTGNSDHEEEYRKQVKNYISLVKELYPAKAVRGLLIYIDLMNISEVA